MSNPTELQTIRERINEATKGPWVAEEEVGGAYADQLAVVRSYADKNHPYSPTRVVSVGQTYAHIHKNGQHEKNVTFIAHSRQDLETLLDIVETISRLESTGPDPEDNNEATHAYEQGRNDLLLEIRSIIHSKFKESNDYN